MKSRSYTLKARGDAVRETHRRILRAATDLFWEKATPEITLNDIAERSSITVQTILRHFGTRDQLFAALESFIGQEVAAERRAPAGDVDAAIRAIFDHYELRGDATLRLLGQEFWNERIREVNDLGRRTHRRWVTEVFGPLLAARMEAERDALTDLLVVATDIYTWKLLRRDRQLDRPQAEQRVRRLIDGILVIPADDPAESKAE